MVHRHAAMFVQTPGEVPDAVVRWIRAEALEEGCAHHVCTPEPVAMIFDVEDLLLLADELTENPDSRTPPEEVMSWLREQASAARRERAARLIWVG